MKHNYRYLNYVGDSQFENRFATTEEMQAALTRLDISDPSKPLPAGGVPLISDTKTVYADTQDYHTLILGSTGSMKTRTLIVPTILTLGLADENLVIADPKGELYDFTSGYLQSRGYQIHVLNLRDMQHSDCWNPLAEAYALYHAGEFEAGLNIAHEFVNSITQRVSDQKSPSWALAARQLLDGLVELMIRGATRPEECNPGSLSTLLSHVKNADEGGNPSGFMVSINQSNRTFLEFVNSLPEGCSIKNNLFSAVNMSKTATATLAGVLDNAYSSIAAFTSSRSLMALTSATTFDIHDLAKLEGKHAIFLIVPDEDTTHHFVVTSFIKQLYTTMVKESYQQSNGQLPRRLNFVLDEFANLPYIQDMPQMITAARSRNMRFFLVVQSDNQLHSTYGEDAETIKTNCLNWVYLSTKEDQLIQQIQRMVGVRGNGSREPLISYQELSAMRKVIGEKGGADALVLMHRCRPYVSFMPDIARYKQFALLEKVPFPEVTAKFQVFDLEERVLTMDEDEAESVFGQDGFRPFEHTPEEGEAEPEPEPQPDKKPRVPPNPFAGHEHKTPELEPDPEDADMLSGILKKLNDLPDE